MKKNTDLTRREFIKGAAGIAGATVLASCGLSGDALEAFLQKHFKELSNDEKAEILKRIEDECKAKYGKEVAVVGTPAEEGVLFAYALDISRCIGCRRCVYGCCEENNQSRDPHIHWITVLEMDKSEGVNLEKANSYYEVNKVPQPDKFYFPVACQQCENPPCVKVCPVKATWKEPDGIVVVDYNWCIGCRCCITACPYGARHFNWAEPKIPTDELNPSMHYLGNRPRMKGCVEKCTFCIQRTRGEEKKYPKCVEVCPVGARKFGNLLDPSSEIRYILANKRVFIFKEELNTRPKFFYYYGL